MTTRSVVPGQDSQDVAPAGSLRDFYEDPNVPASSGPDRAYRQAKMLAEVLAATPPPGRVLDIGCGDGFATQVAARHNQAHYFAGLDWSAPSLAQARGRGIAVLRAGLDVPLPIRSETIDVVVMSEVIEHLVDTDAAVEEARRVLKPGGSLLLSTPNLAAWYNRGLLALGIQPIFSEVSLRGVYGRPGSQVAGHLHMFTRRALVEFLAAHGLRSVRVRGARYHDVPAPLRPADRLFCHWPSAASILLVQARKE
ncbi:MAG TPA: methyltransferase domain-containing protein [Streptosporangiaceae bacterium]